MSDRYTDRLSDYLDEELDESERLEIETHLRECPRVRFDARGAPARRGPRDPPHGRRPPRRGARSLAGHRGAPRTEAARPPVRPARVRPVRPIRRVRRSAPAERSPAPRRGLPGHGGAVGHGGLVRRGPRAPRLRRADSGLDGRCRVPGGLLAGSQLGRRGRPPPRSRAVGTTSIPRPSARSRRA